MNLSQDEINALLTGGPQDDADANAADIMSPDAIAAMLNEPAGDTPDETESVEIMTPEAIAAMLDSAAGLPGVEPEPDALYEADADSILDNLLAGVDSGAQGGAAADAGDGLANVPEIKGMLTAEEIDILGEVGNISMGAVATTMYSLLDRRVSITTPRVSVFEAKNVLSIYKIPFVVATIEYIEGITGTNLLVLKIHDAALITDLLMGGEGVVEEPIELNEMHLSAMSEIMNQMMWASSTSLSKLLQVPINISPPKSSTVDVGFDVSQLLGNIELVTKISFDMEIEGLLSSELIQLVPYELSRQHASRFKEVGMGEPSGDSAKAIPPPPAAPKQAAPPPPPPPPAAPVTAPAQERPAPQPAAPPIPEQPAYTAPQTPPPAPPGTYSPYPPAYTTDSYQQPYPPAAQPAPYAQAPYPQYPPAPYPPGAYAYPPQAYQQPGAAPGRLVDVHQMQFQSFDNPGPVGEQKGIDLVYNIPLQVSVELGKTKKEISEILEFSTGTIIVLDKIAGDPVEIVVNGKLIARGEVVVIDENYGVRITDIING